MGGPGAASEAAFRVVIIGGHPVILGVLRLACKDRADIDLVAEADSGARAVECVVCFDVDLIVLDLELPDMDGLDALLQIRAHGFTGRVLVLSDRVDGAVVLRALRLGVDGYMTKVDGLRIVRQAVRDVAAGRRVLHPSLEQNAAQELARFVRRAREGLEVARILSIRERQVLGLLAEGLTIKQVGRALSVSPRTAETHVAGLYRKLSVQTRVQAVARGASLGLVDFS